METREIWIRIGVYVSGTKEEIEKVICGDAKTLEKLLTDKNFSVTGNAYIPEESIAEYNEDYDADFEENEVEFDL